MTDPNATPPYPAQGKPTGRGASRLFAWLLALVLLAAVAGAAYYVYRRQLALEAGLASSNTQAQALRGELAQARAAAEAARRAAQAGDARLAALSARIDAADSRDSALEARYQELSRGRDDWTLQEVQQTVGAASRQLQLTGDLDSALRALQNADARLALLDAPRAQDARRAVQADIARLKALPRVDTAARASQLDAAVAAVERLPLSGEVAHVEAAPAASAPAAAAPVSGGFVAHWNAFWRRVLALGGDSLSHLVQVRRLSPAQNDAMLLTPQQGQALRDNLKLRLLSARLSLLARDGATMRSDLQAADEALARYFDPSAAAVSRLRSTLAALQQDSAAVAVPSLDASLDALQQATARTGG